MTMDGVLYSGMTALAASVALLYRRIETGLKTCEEDRRQLLGALIKSQADEDRHLLLNALLKQQADERAAETKAQAADCAAYQTWRSQQRTP